MRPDATSQSADAHAVAVTTATAFRKRHAAGSHRRAYQSPMLRSNSTNDATATRTAFAIARTVEVRSIQGSVPILRGARTRSAQRAASSGVSVNEVSSEKAVAKTMTNPNSRM